MACLFAARLAPHAQVTLLGTWKEAIEAIGSKGLQLEDAGERETFRFGATDQPEDCSASDLIIVLVKSWQTEQAVERAKSCLAPNGLAITLQNGLGNLETTQRTFGPERTRIGVTAMGATLLGPGQVRVGGQGLTYLGEDAQRVHSLFSAAGLEVDLAPNVDSILWGKLIVNAAMNPVTALLRLANGELPKHEETRSLTAAIAREAAAVAQAKGIVLPYPDPAEQLFEVARRTAINRSSMLQDVERGRPTEIDAINGAIVRQAKALGLDAPLNWTLWQLVRGLGTGKQK